MKLKFKMPKPTATQKSLILAVLSGIGVGITGVVSAKCAKKTTDDMSIGQKVKTYLPAIMSGGATIGCIAASTYISHEEIALVTAGMAALGRKFADYKKSVEEVVTDEQREQIDISFYEKEIARLEEELAERDHPTDEDDLVTFVDSYAGYTFKARLDEVADGIEEIKRMYDENEYFYWCDVFFVLNNKDCVPYDSFLGSSDGYDGWGWSKAMFETFEVEDAFDIYLEPMKDKPNTYLIRYGIEPEPGFMEY